MAGIRLEWAQFGDFDSFDVIRSDAPMDINALPSPIATNLPTMYHVDTTVVEGATYYYRVVAWRDGVSKVSGEISVLATQGDLYFANVVGLIGFENGFIGDVGDVWVKEGNASVVTVNPMYGTASLKTNGRTDGCSIENDGLINNDNDAFTIEVFFRINQLVPSYGTTQNLFWTYSSGPWGDSQISFSDQGKLFLSIHSGGSSWIQNHNLATLVVNQDYHLALVYSQATGFMLFLDGVRVSHLPSNKWQTPTSRLRFGTAGKDSYQIGSHCLFDEIRITKDVARYTANFTPPNAPFPSY